MANRENIPSIFLRILGVIGILFGLSFGLPGIALLVNGGSWFFAIAGTLTVISGLLIFRSGGAALRCTASFFCSTSAGRSGTSVH